MLTILAYTLAGSLILLGLWMLGVGVKVAGKWLNSMEETASD